ncbi:MAG: hypothetical protein SGJ18_13210 [Pseudomonadota bacterium]|nr:hypothetical protein [Pseudomonadota bacterium]
MVSGLKFFIFLTLLLCSACTDNGKTAKPNAPTAMVFSGPPISLVKKCVAVIVKTKSGQKIEVPTTEEVTVRVKHKASNKHPKTFTDIKCATENISEKMSIRAGGNSIAFSVFLDMTGDFVFEASTPKLGKLPLEGNLSIRVRPDELFQFQIIPSARYPRPGDMITLEISARDKYGSLIEDFNNAVNVGLEQTVEKYQIKLPPQITLVNGKAQIKNIQMDGPAGDYTFTIKYKKISSESLKVTVQDSEKNIVTLNPKSVEEENQKLDLNKISITIDGASSTAFQVDEDEYMINSWPIIIKKDQKEVRIDNILYVIKRKSENEWAFEIKK